MYSPFSKQSSSFYTACIHSSELNLSVFSKRHLIRMRKTLGVGTRSQCESPIVDISAAIQIDIYLYWAKNKNLVS